MDQTKNPQSRVVSTSNGHYVTVDKNVNIYVEDVGEGAPVVFLHGLPVDHRMYEYQRNVLPFKGIRFIGIDLRGFGKSDRPITGYDYNRLSDDIREVIDQLNLDQVTLVGYSMGGAIAVRYMARHNGHGVSKLILAAAATPLFSQKPDYPFGLPIEVIDSIIASGYEDRPQMIAAFNSTLFHNKPSQEFMDWYNRLSLETDAIATFKCLEALGAEDSREDLAAIKVPTRIFQGMHDQMIPFEPQEKGIENAQVIRFENSGHGLWYEEKDKFNEEILKFVQS
ncbi:alpha/beta hydrolase [Paenibacillus durus]|uniref:Alpha/beta hydrolase n=2 Tax=Paenibacillus durus TaxID=44251 RepID=A0A089HJM7_PAEDU|nr:alpha/beta hydrolase [Paenibacillus durus]